ncbi:MAG: aldehyde dehydrogenase (NADP(+)) [Bacteroidetes bacterium]|nr:aldehyde dehydrogenase (NADP(+)) [Bacteroidota bacterium]MBU1720339.1 aldehyde dehydrogenase (NADP(+)) [Bacteroidota bacterium]
MPENSSIGHRIGNRIENSGDGRFSPDCADSSSECNESFPEVSAELIHEAMSLAEEAFRQYCRKSGVQKGFFLEKIAAHLSQRKEEIISVCSVETALPVARLEGEMQRTINQINLFAQMLREGSWVIATISTSGKDNKPDVRKMLQPIGPVAVFSAGNFPLAFSVAGGDTISALAAGCTVVVKAHPGHPKTSEIVADLIIESAIDSEMPEGVFSMLHGEKPETGRDIVSHSLLKAVGFTGSLKTGREIFRIASEREEPIPVFAEMGSSNPVFILPGAMKDRAMEIAEGLVASVLLGVGQFCTCPGLVFLPAVKETDQFIEHCVRLFSASQAGKMLSTRTCRNYQSGVVMTAGISGIDILATGKPAAGDKMGVACLFEATADAFFESPEMEEEVFGPATILVTTDSNPQFYKLAEKLNGHLSISIHGNADDQLAFRALIPIVAQKAGRIVWNGFPTGVEVSPAMHHGGPFPATTSQFHTSVGLHAIQRFAAPVCYQNFPQHLLPPELQDTNPLAIARKINEIQE